MRRSGFTFTEILFAVMILGIGFIMVAAIFPVAIQQTEANNQETIAASIGRSTTGFIEKIAQGQAFYPNANSWPLPTQPMAQPGSFLVPTFENKPIIPVFLNNQTTTVIPGEVWSFFDDYTRQPRDWFMARLAGGQPPVPVTATPVHHYGLLWGGIAKNLVVPSDPRFAAVIMYKRDLIAQLLTGTNGNTIKYTAAPFAQVIVVTVQARNKQVYNLNGNISDITLQNGSITLLPRLLPATITSNGGISTISFQGTAANTPVAENAYIVVSNDYTFPVNNALRGRFNGRIFRVGNSIPPTTRNNWELAPGSDLTAGDVTVLTGGNPMGLARINADVLVVGRALDPNNPNQFTGLAQDVSVYSSYVQIPN